MGIKIGSVEIAEPVFISLCTVLGYLWTFCYEYGYMTYFGIPTEMISLNVTTILITIIVTIFFFFSILQAYQLVIFTFKLEKYVNYDFCVFVMALIFSVYVLLKVRFDLAEVWPFLLLSALSFLDFKYNSRKTNALGSQDKNKNEFKDALHVLLDYLGPQILIIIIILSFGSWISYVRGHLNAKAESYFYTFRQGKSENIILRMYGDRIIYTSYNKTNKSVQPEYKIIAFPIHEFSKVFAIKREEVGPLKIEK